MNFYEIFIKLFIKFDKIFVKFDKYININK